MFVIRREGEHPPPVNAEARALVSAGRGRELMLAPGWWQLISAERFLDRMAEMPDLLELAPTVRCPTLFIRGDQEYPEIYPAEAFQRRAGDICEVAIVPNCDHFHIGPRGGRL